MDFLNSDHSRIKYVCIFRIIKLPDTAQKTSTLYLYQTQGVEGSQPAMKVRRNEDVKNMYRTKDVNVRMNVMYNMCECYHHVL
jgi:hypothetical protein